MSHISQDCRHWNGQCTSGHALMADVSKCKCAFWSPKTPVELLTAQLGQATRERDEARAEIEQLKVQIDKERQEASRTRLLLRLGDANERCRRHEEEEEG